MGTELDRFRQSWLEEVEMRNDASNRVDTAPLEDLEVVVSKKSDFQALRPAAAYHNEALTELDLQAIEKFEKAIDMEHNGSFSDAVIHYREAYQMNDKVDKLFREKYYSPEAKQVQDKVKQQQETELLKQLQDMKLRDQSNGVNTLLDNDEASPFSELPSEIIVRIMKFLALDDINSFLQLLLACRRTSKIGTSNDTIWKALCMRTYPAMVYSPEITQSLEDVSAQALVDAHYKGSWKNMYKKRPFIRFNGVYVSTCTYLRHGQYSGWNTPIQMVTYYRYLRFYRDGTCMSFLTVLTPEEVIPVFFRHTPGTPPIVCTREDGTIIHRPKGIVSGTWHLNSIDDGSLSLQTEGSVSTYDFFMQMEIRSSGSRRHNKLKWVRFWHVKKGGDSTEGEFSLKHEKGYFFVKTRR